jgi:MazG family protein
MADHADDGAAREFSLLFGIIRELRRRCPWDREQTIASLGRHLVEEAYEALDAIERDSTPAIVDELGDVIAQALAIGAIAEEGARFTIAQVMRAAADKLVRRHPHVYADAQAGTPSEVVANWERIKQAERAAAGAKSALDGVARSLPAAARAEKLGARAREAGMDWRDIHEVLAKVREEMDEVEGALAADDLAGAAAEIGDMMLALANAPRFIGHRAEETLRRSCDKFTARFGRVERIAAARGLDLRTLPPEQLDALWNEAKRAETADPPPSGSGLV